MLPKEAIEEFKAIYKKEFSKEISDEEASLRANNLVNLYEAVYGDRVNQNKPNNNKCNGKD